MTAGRKPMPPPSHAFALLLASISLLSSAGTANAAERFHKLWCLKYAVAPQAPLSALLAGAPADQKLDLPFAMCAARSKSRVLVLDSGYLNQKLGEPFGARDWVEYGALLGEVGIKPEEVDYVTISHLHFDHAGGTSKFPKAKFILQKRELEFAAAAMPHNSAARNAFTADDVLAAVALNWQGRVLLVDGDQEDVIPGVDVYLTPGHTAGTMTVCLDTTRERFCYSSDAVYTYRNIDEDIPLGLALDSYQAVESYKKIRRILRGGTLIPGHEPRLFDEPQKLGFRRVSAHAIALVE
jgi:glyoxylase-like metal-dependent hydrolase (beta-lactamase superfamily II)